MFAVYLDAREFTDKEASHEYLQKEFHFPEYYGSNLDALYDCLTELPPTEIFMEHVDEAGMFYPVIRHVIHSAKKENRFLRLLIVDNDEEDEE